MRKSEGIASPRHYRYESLEAIAPFRRLGSLRGRRMKTIHVATTARGGTKHSGKRRAALWRACQVGLVLTFSGVIACKRSDSSGADSTTGAAISTTATPVEGAPATTAPQVVAPGAAATAPAGSGATALGPIPAFSGAPKVQIENAIGIGCEANATAGWVQLFCYKRNATGGHPVRAVFDTPEVAALARGEAATEVAPAATLTKVPTGAATSARVAATSPTTVTTAPGVSAEELAQRSALPNERGELVLFLPWLEGRRTTAHVEWSDVAYDLVVEGTTGKLVRPENLPLRRACAQLSREFDELRTSAKQSKNGLTAADVVKLHGFGHCQLSGVGAWALKLRSLVATGAGADRKLTADVEVVRLNADGSQLSAPYATVSFAPEGLEMPLPMMYDYDGDGLHEAIVRYEVNKRPAAESASALGAWSSLFTLKDGKVVAYERGPKLAPGSASVEQLENDLRPDIADYGPFIGWLTKGCGVSNCPDRVAGPRFFWRAVADGSFDNQDASARAALQRSCQKKPATIVSTAGAAANLKTTALHVACARVWQVDSKLITDELTANRDKLCGSSEPCPAFELLSQWANATPPATLSE